MQPRIEVPTCILVCEENPKIKLILKYMDEHALLLINLINKNMDKFCITHRDWLSLKYFFLLLKIYSYLIYVQKIRKKIGVS